MGHVIRARGGREAVALVTPQERSVSKVRHLLLGLSFSRTVVLYRTGSDTDRTVQRLCL